MRQRRKAAASRFGGVARGEPKPIRRAFGVARGEPKPIRRAFASPSWLRSLVHSRFRPPGFARLQGRLIRPGLTPRLRFYGRPVRRRSVGLRPGAGTRAEQGGGGEGAVPFPFTDKGCCASGTGLRVPEAPRLCRGRFAARGPVPFPPRAGPPSRSLSPARARSPFPRSSVSASSPLW